MLSLEQLNEKIKALEVGERLILSGIDEHTYHQTIGIGSTLMKAATKSMAHYKVEMESERNFSAQAIKAMAIGSATHCLVAEAELYDQKFVVQPAEIKVRNGHKWEAFQMEHAGKQVLTEDDQELASAMSSAILDSAGKWFVGGEGEKSYWYHHESGLILKARIDHQLGDAAIDLKTTKDETADKFKKTVKYEYDIQDAHYRLVTDLADMVYVGVSKSKPHSVFLCKQGTSVRIRAEEKIEKAIEDILKAMEFDQYPNVPVELMETELTKFELEKAA